MKEVPRNQQIVAFVKSVKPADGGINVPDSKSASEHQDRDKDPSGLGLWFCRQVWFLWSRPFSFSHPDGHYPIGRGQQVLQMKPPLRGQVADENAPLRTMQPALNSPY